MKKIVIVSFALVCLLLVASTYSFFTFIHNKEYAKFNKVITEFKKKEPLNGVVLIAQGDAIIYMRPFGFSNTQTGAYNTTASEFLLASLSKLYTAAAILLLAQQGKIDINKPVSEYLKPEHPVWQNAMPPAMNSIMVHHLLTHRSGLPKYTQLPGFDEWYEKLHTPEQVIQFFATKQLSFAPGTKFEYTGSNYLLLGLIIEAVTGKPYSAFMNDVFFKPLNLSHTFAPTNAMLPEIQKQYPQLSIGYHLDSQTKQLQPAGSVNMSTAYAEAGIIGNALDLYTFVTKLFSGKIINTDMVNKMTNSYFTTPDGEGIGYGITIDNSLTFPVYTHGGRINGYEGTFLYEPLKKITVIVLSNIMDSPIYSLAYELMETAHSN